MSKYNGTTAFQLGYPELIRDRFTGVIPGKVQVSFVPMADARTVCQVEVPPISSAVYLDDKLYVRDGNGTVELAGPRLEAWIRSRT